MRNNLVFRKQSQQKNNPDEALKVTALLYFSDALFSERFEECAELIKKAKDFGAEQSEVDQIISDYVNQVRKSVIYEADKKGNNRLPN